MAQRTYISNALIVNEGISFKGGVLIHNGIIEKIIRDTHYVPEGDFIEIDAKSKLLIPGIIDDQVHFREPGLTHKADIYTESRAAVAGGITSFMEMPNTIPNTLTQELLEEKYSLGAEHSIANYSFYMGASNDNISEIEKTDPRKVCGIKVFMGSSTGNMLVDDPIALNDIFSKSPVLVAVHCEDEDIIRKNLGYYTKKYGDDIPLIYHPLIRSEEACYKSSSLAVELASKHNTRLHVLHLSTARELDLFSSEIALADKNITAEVCVHHLWFSELDYEKKGTKIKWNPSIKRKEDKEALLHGLEEGKLDIVATDHAPHTSEEKSNVYTKAPSGGPLVQHSLPIMLEYYHSGRFSLEFIVEKMCHNPAICFQVNRRGFIREGYWADLVLVDLEAAWKVEHSNILYKCDWSPFIGDTFRSKITHTFVNGELVFNDGIIDDTLRGKRLNFNR